MQIGSDRHKELFCRTFLEGHRKYEAADLPWPELDDKQLELLRSVPFWTHALQAEADAGPMVTAAAEVATDPLIKEALQLQGYEESRHGRTIQHMIDLYGLEVGDVHVEMPDDIEEAFIDFGFEECLDSFGAFGIFALAREAQLVPGAIYDIFDQVMQEEAHHIVFFLNWYHHRQSHRGGPARALRIPKGLWHYGKALYKLADLVGDDDADEGQDFVVTGAQAFVDNLSIRRVIEACVSENRRRLAGFDPRLLQPRLVPRLAAAAAAMLRLVPRREPPPPPSSPQGVSEPPRAA